MDEYLDDPIAAVTNEDLGLQLAHTLSDTVVAKFVAHGYHWNVMGPDFKEMHAFFSEIYESLDGSIDPLAENLLKIGFDAPYLLTDFMEMACIQPERVDGNNTSGMLKTMLETVEMVKSEYVKLFDIANALNAQDIANFAAEGIDVNAKWAWQLKATLGLR